MVEKSIQKKFEAPKENFNLGLMHAPEIPELGEPESGKVRDWWVIKKNGRTYRAMVTTDRQSAYDALICSVPGKGQVLNLTSAFWFEKTKEIIGNHVIDVPHPNLLIAKDAKKAFPVEIVLRRYMAKSSTSTSIYHNYVNLGRREIYGIRFPEGLKANQEFPMGTIITPTTKAENGHDQELTDEQATELVDRKLGSGAWKKAKNAALKVFEFAYKFSLDNGLIEADTKYEMGVDSDGDLILLDEIHTPDSSRKWLAETYMKKFLNGESPDAFDKDILRRWLAEHGFTGDEPIPTVDKGIINAMAEAYTVPYRMMTGKSLIPQDPVKLREEISREIKSFIHS